jgi:hypothetical protein
VVRGFSPLDEELELAPGSLAPSLFEGAVRLGTWIPFPRLAAELQYFTRTRVSEPTLRRATEKAGEAYVAVQTRQVEEIERDPSEESPPGPPRQQLSVDGAMVPLRGKGEWAEVKTLALGTIQPAVMNKKGEPEIHTTELSYFSRLADHETFARLATVETHRRGTVRAGRVGAVVDGAEWEQKFVDLHRPDAVRILDWGHAAEYVAKVGQAVFGAGTSAASEWLGTHLHALKHGDPTTVLATLRDMRDGLVASGNEETTGPVAAVLTASIDYLEKRREQIRYAEFQAQGYPIGSGIVESANKLVVEARLKGAGMHWAREHVNPMVALRTIACSDRWEEAWPQILRRLREAQRQRTAQRRAKRHAEQAQTTVPNADANTPDTPTKKPQDTDLTLPTTQAVASPSQPQVKTPYRPAPDHPWRHQRIGRSQTQQTRTLVGAKT